MNLDADTFIYLLFYCVQFPSLPGQTLHINILNRSWTPTFLSPGDAVQYCRLLAIKHRRKKERNVWKPLAMIVNPEFKKMLRFYFHRAKTVYSGVIIICSHFLRDLESRLRQTATCTIDEISTLSYQAFSIRNILHSFYLFVSYFEKLPT